jgi:hypothetical protein
MRDDKIVYDSIDAIDRWGWEIEQKAIAEAVRVAEAAPATGMPADFREFVALMAKESAQATFSAIQPAFASISARQDQAESLIDAMRKSAPFCRDGRGFVTTKTRCFERGINPDELCHGGGARTFAGHVGILLASWDCEKGPHKEERRDDKSVRIKVNTWRRDDIDRAIDALLAESAV